MGSKVVTSPAAGGSSAPAVHEHTIERFAYDHDTALGANRHERRTRWVVALTVSMMVVELVVGRLSNSLALTADGWHMATHAGALGLSALAYWFARTRAQHEAFTFGTGKVYALAGYTSAVLLALVAAWMLIEAVRRLLSPSAIDYSEALPVAFVGLAVNVISVALLDHRAPADDHAAAPHTHDHNLRAAYVHVLADALTSVLAIVALLAGRYLGWIFLDPAMGLVGGAVILRWSAGLSSDAAKRLLDVSSSRDAEEALRHHIEAIDDVQIADLHLWEMGPGRHGCIVSLISAAPRDTGYYRERILAAGPLAHLTVEVHRCREGCEPDGGAAAAR